MKGRNQRGAWGKYFLNHRRVNETPGQTRGRSGLVAQSGFFSSTAMTRSS
jgi:hypothetical protein